MKKFLVSQISLKLSKCSNFIGHKNTQEAVYYIINFFIVTLEKWTFIQVQHFWVLTKNKLQHKLAEQKMNKLWKSNKESFGAFWTNDLALNQVPKLLFSFRIIKHYDCMSFLLGLEYTTSELCTL